MDAKSGKSHSSRNSRSRARRSALELLRSNTWDWFVTLTFSPDVVDRYDYAAVSGCLRSFMAFLRRHGCVWFLVPVQHQDSAFYFEGLVSGPLPMRYYLRQRSRSGVVRDTYTIPSYGYGRSVFSAVDEPEAAVLHIARRVSRSGIPSGRRRYWASRRLYSD